MKDRVRKIVLAVIIMAMFCTRMVFAAEPGAVLSYGTAGSDVVLYVQNPGVGYEYDAQIGTHSVKHIKAVPVAAGGVPIETIVLLDNSLSVTKKYRVFINEVLTELVAKRADSEQFSIAMFSDKLEYLVQNCSDPEELKRVIDGISYNDQETYLTDVLYELLQSQSEEAALRKIVIISDGVDNKAIGYTKDELYKLIEKKSCPIFTLGCTYKNNNEQLKNMYALSRKTGAQSFHLDDVTDSAAIVSEIASVSNAVQVVISPEEQDRDGSTKGVHLVMSGNGDSIQRSIEVKMPFGKVEAPTESIAETETEAETETIMETPEFQDPPSPEEGKNSIVLLLIAGLAGLALILLIASIVLFILNKNKQKREEERFQYATPPENGALMNRQKISSGSEGKADGETGSGTSYIWGSNGGAPYLILENTKNPNLRYEADLSEEVMVGYDADCQISIRTDRSVSGKHCIIYCSNGEVYVENRSHTNGTILDGTRINSGRLTSGSVLTLGRVSLMVTIQEKKPE